MSLTESYDTLRRVSSVVNALGTFNYGYQNDSNRMTSMSIPNGEQVTATYLGAAGDFRLSQIQNLQSAASGGANISTFGYTYNPEGAIATWSQALGTGAAVNYTLSYDNTDELTSGTATGSSYGYTYDAGGNRLSETINGATRTAVYNAANQLQQLTPAKSGDKTYQWDAENRLVGINYTGTNQSTQLKYDGFGRCVEIQELTGGAITSTRLFVWCGAERCEEHNATNAVTKRFFAQGEQINGQSYYYLKDHLGSIRELTDSTGAIKAEYSYDFWGRPTLVQGTNLADFQYAGMFAHQPSGLNLTMFRAYDTNTGRWLSRDPLPDAERRQGPNLYEYVSNKPINMVDPLGLWGGGVAVGGQAGAGVGVGSGYQVSGGAGSFYNPDTGGTTLGGYVSNGGMAGGMDGNNAIAGGSAGVGGGFFFTNAKCPSDLKGPFQQWDANFPLFSINFASSNGTWIVSITAGPSTPTISFTSYTTTTTGTAQTPAF